MSNQEINQDFNEVMNLFIEAVVAFHEEPNHFKAKAKKFNTRLDRFFSDYPDESLASIAMGITQLGVSYEEAMANLLQMRIS